MRKHFSKSWVAFGGLWVIATLSSCAGERVKPHPLAETADPTVEMGRLNSGLMEAQKNQVDVLAATNFTESQEALMEAKSLREQNAANKDVLEKVSEGLAHLDRANEIAQGSRSSLDNVLLARQDALSAGAEKYFRQDLIEADAKLMRKASSIAKGDTISDQDRAKLISSYKNLETRSTLQTAMDGSVQIINTAKKEGAEKWAPKTLRSVEQKESELRASIIRDPKDTQAIRSLSEQLRAQADLLLRVTRQSKLVGTRDPEDAALRIESQKNRISQLKKEKTSTEQHLSSEQQRLAAMEEQERFNQRFREIGQQFSPDEAEVVRTDHTIIIRLKGLNFPSSGTDIPKENYALLKKVGDAVKDLGANRVIVQGHTDSKGSYSKNVKISQQRAQAVRNFLVANQGISEENIKTEGKGPSAPIASNRTSEGRAQNRRVDIMIQTTS